MKKYYTNSKGEISYTLHGDYYLPDFVLLENTDTRPIGIYGEQHRRYLKSIRKFYTPGYLLPENCIHILRI